MTSLVYHRLPIWRRSIYWSTIAGYVGLYEVVSCVLRSMLEDITQAIYLDQQFGESKIDVKLNKLSNLRDEDRWGFSAFCKKINPPEFLNTKMRSLWKELCRYVHPSRELIEMEVRSRRIIQEYVQNEFARTFENHIQTCDIVMALVLWHFPKTLKCFMRQDGTVEDCMQDLREQNFICTARICSEQYIEK